MPYLYLSICAVYALSFPPEPGTITSYLPSDLLKFFNNLIRECSLFSQSIFFSFSSWYLHAAQTPFSSKWITFFFSPWWFLNSIDELGLWLEITHFLQKITFSGSPFVWCFLFICIGNIYKIFNYLQALFTAFLGMKLTTEDITFFCNRTIALIKEFSFS